MSRSSDGNGDVRAVMNGGEREHPAGLPEPEAGAGSRRELPGGSAGPATIVRTRQHRDYRHRGLRTGPAGDVQASPSRTDLRHRHRQRPLLAMVGVFVVVTVAAVLVLRAFIVQSYAVPGDAMTPTLQAGDRILVLKSGLLGRPIRSGDVVVFHPPKSLPCSVIGAGSGDLVLRVVGVPGQVISSVGDAILVNGQPLRERGWYDPRFGQVGSTPVRSTSLGTGQYFLMDDNRSDACDSRTFGPIAKASVVGQGIAIVGRHGHVSFGTL